jgi:hypothetical protein
MWVTVLAITAGLVRAAVVAHGYVDSLTIPWRVSPVLPSSASYLSLFAAVGALLLLSVPVLLQERNRRQRRWVQHHFRAEPHPSADDLTSLDQDSESEPSFSWRLQAHGDAGSQTLKEGD